MYERLLNFKTQFPISECAGLYLGCLLVHSTDDIAMIQCEEFFYFYLFIFRNTKHFKIKRADEKITENN